MDELFEDWYAQQKELAAKQTNAPIIIPAEEGRAMTVYIAGPITGDAGYRLKFAAVAYAIRKKKPDAAVLNPASLPEWMDRPDYMAICLSMLMRADVVFLLPGWRSSGGAQVEKRLAEYLRIRVIEIGDDLLQKFMEDINKQI